MKYLSYFEYNQTDLYIMPIPYYNDHKEYYKYIGKDVMVNNTSSKYDNDINNNIGIIINIKQSNYPELFLVKLRSGKIKKFNFFELDLI